MRHQLNHIDALESEAIFILREVVAECQRPVMLYSIGKDSSVLLRLAQKAFAPGAIPFPLLHVDTGFKFPEMIAFRDQIAKELGLELLVWRNEDAIREGMNPYDYGRQACCGALKTTALLDALKHYAFDAAFGGARRDEEKSRAKERVFSFRDRSGQWDPKNQRPELWHVFNTLVRDGESMRVFPLSNWTERDIWNYIRRESIPLVSLYLAQERKVLETSNGWIGLDDFPFTDRHADEATSHMCRYRSLGCMPCTAALPSDAESLDQVVQEMIEVTTSERALRMIDHDTDDAMEQKKREGYF
ncbi:MAG: sulfate adenylyltransferase subunit CysD [Acidobacteria bacterium]|nr:sulfate adenylyltransferase subunit CysD [Acidobacteriota bacterium]